MNSETLELKRKRDAIYSLCEQVKKHRDGLEAEVERLGYEWEEADKLYFEAFMAEPTFKEKERTEK